VWFPKARQFSFQRVEEGRYKLTSTGNHGIVTVATMMAAEGQVQVGGVVEPLELHPCTERFGSGGSPYTPSTLPALLQGGGAGLILLGIWLSQGGVKRRRQTESKPSQAEATTRA
jgi:hypothetical protein